MAQSNEQYDPSPRDLKQAALRAGKIHNSLAETPPPRFSAVKVHARSAAPEAALTALNHGGPLADKRSMDWHARGAPKLTDTFLATLLAHARMPIAGGKGSSSG